MKSVKLRNSALLLLTALIWGISFVSQSEGGDAIGPYAFNSLRSFLGAGILVPVFLTLDKLHLSPRKPKTIADHKKLWLGGCLCGLALCVATNLQQIGIYLGTPVGKSGFLTACYILIVPILGIFLKKKCTWNIWLGVAITLGGLYLLCMNGSFSLQLSDLLTLLCAFVFSIQIMLVDHFSPQVDGVRLSAIQFLVTGILTAFPMFFVDMHHSAAGFLQVMSAFKSWDAWIPLLYAGIMSCGVAYTLQIIAQNGLNPTVASLLMSLESVFSVLAGWVLLHQVLSGKEILGCVLIFAAIVLAQLPIGEKKKAEKT